MRRIALFVGLTAVSLAFASQAAAATAVNVKASFTQGVAQQFGCAFQETGFCGTGNVLPFGKATEVSQPGFGCDTLGACDLRTITLPHGTLVLDEIGSFVCQGKCSSHGVGSPNGATLSDVVDGTESTGIFQGASGPLSGSIKFSGGSTQVSLSGTIFVP